MNIKLFELHKLCEKYDDEYGQYPEHMYEGKAVYEFIERELFQKEEEDV